MSSQRPIIGLTAELERQAWDDEGREKDRQKALSGASEGDGLALGGLEGMSSAGVSATANLRGDVQVRLVSRSCRSSRAIRHADRQPRCGTCHVGPRLRLLYASSSGLLSSSISIVCRPCHGTIVLA